MEMEFLTLLNNYNDWLDWAMLWFPEAEGLEEPKSFPCYVNFECIGFDDLEVEDDCKGEAIFWPHFLYLKDVKEMLDNLD